VCCKKKLYLAAKEGIEHELAEDAGKSWKREDLLHRSTGVGGVNRGEFARERRKMSLAARIEKVGSGRKKAD